MKLQFNKKSAAVTINITCNSMIRQGIVILQGEVTGRLVIRDDSLEKNLAFLRQSDHSEQNILPCRGTNVIITQPNQEMLI